MKDVISKTDARAAGLLRYFTGRPCKRGHVSERLVSNCNCVDCLNAQNSRWKKLHVKRCSAAKLEWCKRNRDKVRALKRGYYARSETERQKQAARGKRWLQANPEKSSANSNAWRRRNLAQAAARQRRRWASLLKRLPPWADHAKIRKFYDLARELTEKTGIPHEVDHIYPLQGRLVSGLHVEINLQVLPRRVNRSKGARFPETATAPERN